MARFARQSLISAVSIGVLLAAGTVLGWLGAWISAARHLHSIEPRE